MNLKFFCATFSLIIFNTSIVSGLICEKINVVLKSLNYCKNVDHQIIKIYNNMTFRVTENCELMTKSCTFISPYNKANLELSFYKGKSRLFKEKIDLCIKGKKVKEMTQMMFDAMGITAGCPVTKNKTIGCNNRERSVKLFSVLNQNSIKTMLGGDSGEYLRLPVNIEHDTGRTCFEITVTYSGIPKRG